MQNHSEQTVAVMPDFNWCLNYFAKRGIEHFGSTFRIATSDNDVIYKLLAYFIGNEAEATRLGLDLTKGIWLTGPIGCGKTSLMTLMKYVPAPERNYVIKPCRDISFEFRQEGYSVIDHYSRYSFTDHRARGYCFDDLGAERTIKHYGNECNVMGEILLSRYELFRSCGMLTHITTNLSASEVEAQYGERLRSRLREMCNVISFDEGARDKR
jgi:hypothetical protein